MAYFLKRTSDGKYVAQSGSKSSYTHKLENAQQYISREAALQEACDNEVVVRIPLFFPDVLPGLNSP